MTHCMNLELSAFLKIAKGSKTIELRLNDEKRQEINIGDRIEFRCSEINSVIFAEVIKLHKFLDFEQLYKALPLEKCGYSENDLKTAHYTDMEKYYTKSQIKKYGALGIELQKITAVADVKASLFNPEVLTLLKPSVFNPTPERLKDRAEKYSADKNTFVYACKIDGVYAGIVVLKTENNTAEILDIAVKPEYRKHGIGRRLIDFIFSQFPIDNITAETDDEAVGFYKKCGFAVASVGAVCGTKRYFCKLSAVLKHYDLLIEENNDPVRDPEPLRQYMDKWDGQQFIDSLQLTKEKSVLEIGVGTGRLAVRVAPECREFCGIDLSPKTVKRAKENLKEQTNVTLICGDFMSYEFERKFDVIYSSLTFMHIKEKPAAINKVKLLLKDGGRFVLSIDKNQSDTIDYGTRKIQVYPDCKEDIAKYMIDSGMELAEMLETKFAYIFLAKSSPITVRTEYRES